MGGTGPTMNRPGAASSGFAKPSYVYPQADQGATLVCAVAIVPIGLVWGNLDWAPEWKAQGYLLLLALSSQALGWLLISITLPRLPAALTSVLLTFQPVLSVLFAWAILGESPSALQLVGVALVLCGLLIVSAGRRQEQRPEPGYVPELAEVPD